MASGGGDPLRLPQILPLDRDPHPPLTPPSPLRACVPLVAVLVGHWLTHDIPARVPQEDVVRPNRSQAVGCSRHEHTHAVHPRVVANGVAREERVATTVDVKTNVVAPNLVAN